MQTYKHFIAFLSIIILNVSCANFLEKEPYGSLSFWNSAEQAELGINAAYAPLYEEEFYGRGQFWFSAADDDMTINNNSKTSTINQVNFVSTSNDASYANDYWILCYRTIRRANDVLRNVPKIEMDTKVKNRILGEANFMLAFAYFQLAQRHGGLPFADMENPANTNISRSTKQDTYLRIEAYLLKATTLFTEWQYQGANYGRASLGASWSLLAKVYAHWGKFDKCKAACEKVIWSDQFTLLNEYKKVFSLAHEKSSEHIFSLVGAPSRHQSTITAIVCLSKALTGGGGWKYFAPTKSLANAFENGDSRKKSTIVGIGDQVRFLQKDIVLSHDNLSDMETGYMCVKYAQPYEESSSYSWETGLDIPIIRYADVLLLHAEALIMLNGGGSEVAKRNVGVPAAAESFNLVRLRAFNQDQTKYINAPTFMDLVKERRCELAFEESRHYDLVRWGLAKEFYQLPKEPVSVYGSRNFDPSKHNHFMLPQIQLEISDGLLVNNPLHGYSSF